MYNRQAKRFLSLLLCIMFTITMLPLDVLAGTSSDAPALLSAATAGGDTAGAPAGQPPANNAGGGAMEFDNPFGDVEPGDWFFNDVGFVYTQGLMSGTGTETPLFSPDLPMSRAMLVTVLYRLAGSPDTSALPNVFTDVAEDSWYSDAVAWAAANGITSGVGGNRFAPDDSVTREQVAAFLLKYARLIGKGPAGEITGGSYFADKDKISAWALESAMWCSMIGVIRGKPAAPGGNTGMLFDPQGKATRAELAAMLHRFADHLASSPAGEQPATPGSGSSPGSGPGSGSGSDSDDSTPGSGPSPGSGPGSGSGSGSDSDSDDYLAVSFETNGGTRMDPVSVARGEKLPDVSIPLKDDCTFTGWYTDSSLTQPFYSDAPITKNMTLYASYADRDYNYREYVDAVKFLPDCPAGVSFDVLSPETITDSNLDDYITIQNKVYSDEIPELDVTSRSEGVYTVSPEAPYTYTPGDTYELSLIDEDITFNNEKEEVRTMAFSIEKPETYNVQFKDGIVYLLWNQVQVIDSGVYSLPKSLADAKGIAVGTTICLTDEIDSNGQGILNENAKIRNVLSMVNTDATAPPRVMLFTEASSPEDVYQQLDIYLQESVDPENLVNSLDVKKLERDLKNSEGTRQFTKLLAVALNESPTVAAMSAPAVSTGPMAAFAAGSSPAFSKPTESDNKINLTVDALVQGLTITASVGTAQNTNFPDAAGKDWVVLAITFDYNATISKLKLQVDADFTFKEFITLSAGKDIDFLKDWQFVTLDAWVDTYSQTDVEFNVLVRTVDVDEEYLNITAEIEKLIDGSTEDNSDVPGIIREVLGSKGDYIELAKVDLYEYTYNFQDPCPVVQMKLDCDFVVRLNLAVGLSAQSTLMSARRIGIRGGTGQALETYSYELEGDGRQSLDLYCAGYIGVKAGVKLTMSIYFLGCESLGKVGFAGETGAYMDLYGFLQLHLLKDGIAPDPEINMNGGVYMEVGIYLELGIFVESKTFKAKAECSFLDEKFRLYSLGDQYVLYRFKNAGKTVVINQNDYYISDSGLLDCEMLDLTTGQVVKGDYTKLKNFYFEISNPFMIDWNDETKNHIEIQPEYFGRTYQGVTVNEGDLRMDATVKVYYGGDNLCFSSRDKGYTYNEIKLIWVHPSIDPETVNLNTVTATYLVNMDGVTTTAHTKTVLAGTVPGPIDLSPWLKPIKGLARYQEAEIQGYVGDWNDPIWEDATYTVNMAKLQALVSYIYMGDDGQWNYEVYAVEIGDTPPVPPDYESVVPGKTFKHWMRRDYTFINYSYAAKDYDSLTSSYMAIAWAAGLTYTGYDKTKPVYTFNGTEEECYQKFNENQKTTPVLFHNVAQYETWHIRIQFIYPNMIYKLYGKDIDISYPWEWFYFHYGETPLPPKQRNYPGCTILGWSHDYRSRADYEFDKLPPVTKETYYYLIVEFKERQIIFKTDMGSFADGSTTADSGMLAYPDYLQFVEDFQNANNARTIQPVLKDGVPYKFQRWEVDYSQDAEGIQTWNAVWVVASGQEFTAAFNAGEGAAFPGGSTSFSLTVTYGTRLDLSSFTTPVKAADNQYTYTLAGWQDQDGKTYGLTDTVDIRKDMTFTAVFTPVPIVYTVTVSAGNGQFPDGTKTKTFTGAYGENTNIAESISAPMPPAGDAVYHYEFDGWLDEFGGWLDAFPDTFTQDLTIVASYKRVYNEYTITFDAGSGSFEGGAKTVTQTYHYGDVIDPPAAPSKAENEYFRYQFTGWSPTLNEGDTVTFSRTYTAGYRSISKGETPPAPAAPSITAQPLNQTVTEGQTATFTVKATGTAPLSYQWKKGETNLSDGGNTATLTITNAQETDEGSYTVVVTNAVGSVTSNAATLIVNPASVASATISPATAAFDKNPAYQADVTTTITWNDAKSVTEIKKDGISIGAAVYTVSEDTLTIKKEYLATQPIGSLALTVEFDKGNAATLTIDISDTTLPESVITVTYGDVTEVISMDSVSGYVYEMVEALDESLVPTLTVKGDGLTFSGASSEVCIIIANTAKNVTFKNLRLSGGYDKSDGVLYLPEGGDLLTVNIEGDCVFEKTTPSRDAVRIERLVKFAGADGDASLQIGASGGTGIFTMNNIAFDNLNLTIDAQDAEGVEEDYISALSEDLGEWAQTVCSFVYSEVNITSGGGGLMLPAFDVEIQDSVFNMVCDGPAGFLHGFTVEDSEVTITATAGQGLWIDGNAVFSGDLQIALEAANAPAISAITGISVPEGYDLGGAEIKQFTDDVTGDYYTFANEIEEGVWTPAAHVTINNNP